MKPTKIGNGSRRGDWNRGFAVEILYPGQTLKVGDSGISAIGRIDRARVAAGHVVAMHPHRDDEILTYVRAGSMLHRDSVQNCVSAWNKDPVFGVIGIQSGPRDKGP
ncbi:pirin family protein, partial [Bradyrhizobium liaoningense]|uniref:pirin family protein n=1 Tax=Bradyrhizobium liaoningense TaxID=43992 RepID=UPI001BAE545C